MKTTFQLIFAGLAVVSFLGACNKGAGGARVKTVTGKGSGANKTDKKDKGGGSTQPTAAESAEKRKAYLESIPKTERKVMKEKMEDLLSLKPLLRDSNDVFIQVWKAHLGKDEKLKIEGNAKAESSIFKLLATTIEQNFAATGVPLTKEVLKDLREKCKNQSIETLGEVTGQSGLYSISMTNCSDIKDPMPIVVNIKKTQTAIDASKPNDKKTVWSLQFEFAAIHSIAGGNSSGSGSGKRIDLYSSLFGKWMPTFFTETAAGNTSNRVSCYLSGLSNLRLESLKCENMGQDLDKQAYVHYKKIEYLNPLESKDAVEAKKEITVLGEVFKINDDGTKTSVTTELKPVNGENLVLTLTQTPAPEAAQIAEIKKQAAASSQNNGRSEVSAAIADAPPAGIEALPEGDSPATHPAVDSQQDSSGHQNNDSQNPENQIQPEASPREDSENSPSAQASPRESQT